MPLVLWIVLNLGLQQLTPEHELRIWAQVYEVDPDLAVAVSMVESRGKDGLISSTGDYGRMQINCVTWRKHLRLRHCRQLLNVHYNAWAGAYILARYQRRFGGNAASWVGHYNSGSTLTDRGRRYAAQVKWWQKKVAAKRHASVNRS